MEPISAMVLVNLAICRIYIYKFKKIIDSASYVRYKIKESVNCEIRKY